MQSRESREPNHDYRTNRNAPAGKGDPNGLMTTGGLPGGAQVGVAADAGVSPEREDYNLLEVYGEATGGFSTAQAAAGVDTGDYPRAGQARGLKEAGE